jgi:hypothetical protein
MMSWRDRLRLVTFAFFVVGFTVAAVLAVRDVVDWARASTTGTAGYVSVQRCTNNTSSRDPEFWTHSWLCTGQFVASDQRFTIASVRVSLHSRTEPDWAVNARVTGPGAHDAWADGEYLYLLLPAAFLLGFMVFVVWVSVSLLRTFGEPPHVRRQFLLHIGLSRQAQRGRARRRRRRR